jgi:hypothetical protein
MGSHNKHSHTTARGAELHHLQISLLETLLDQVRHERLGLDAQVRLNLTDSEYYTPLAQWQAEHLTSQRHATAGSADTQVVIMVSAGQQESELFICNPTDATTLAGWRIQDAKYVPIEADARGWLWSRNLDLWLGGWMGEYGGKKACWLRFYHAQGYLILTPEERSARHWRGVAARKLRGRHARAEG